MEADMDIDDENDWKAMDSDDEETGIHDDGDEKVERDDDVDIGFRSHQFQYGAHGRKRKRSRRENQEEAIYGVFYDGDGAGNRDRNQTDYSENTAPMFVPATREPEAAAPLFVAATKTATTETDPPAPMFVAASKTSDSRTKTDISSTQTASEASDSGSTLVATNQSKSKASTDTTKDNNTSNEDDEEEKRIEQEQKEADNRFMELLEKAKSRNRKTRPHTRHPLNTTTAESATANASNEFGGIGGGASGLGLPSSFGGREGNGLGFSSAIQADKNPVQKDPTVGTWEKHTKGFGSKLLAKMGWKGSGGLGSNRRTFRGEAAKTSENKVAGDKNSAANKTDPPAEQGVKKGISRPVEVVVRPTNMGLGFGNFKESSQLKVNRRIEAEVRGIDYDAQLAKEKEAARAKRREKRKQRYGNQYSSGSSDEDDENVPISRNVKSSAIPTTDDLLSKQSWKAKRSSRSKKSKQKTHPEIIPYQELIQRQKQSSGGSDDKVVIIDMRGPSLNQSTPKPTSSKGHTVALGEELLYNLSFLLGTYENKLHSSSRHHESSILRTIEGLDHQIGDAEDRLQEAENRRNKLARAHQIVESVRHEMSSQDSTKSRQDIHNLVSELKAVFTPSERKELKFWSVLAPTLLGPSMQSMLENWKPFFGNNENGNSDRSIVDAYFECASSSDDSGKEGRILCESMVKTQLIPKLKADIESQALGVWDPVTNPYAVLDLYEYIQTKALAFDKEHIIPTSGILQYYADDDPNQVFPSHSEDKQHRKDLEKEPSSHLAEYIRKTLIRDAVYPKLLAAITNWKPKLSGRFSEKKLQNPLDSWVIPWLPHIDYPILLPNLLAECKRKLKHALSVYQGGKSNMSYYDIDPILDMLRPWCNILDSKSLQKLLLEHTGFYEQYTDCLLCALKGDPRDNNDWKDWRRLLFDLHGNQLLSDIDFLSIVEDFLENWILYFQSFLYGRHQTILPLGEMDFDERMYKEERKENVSVIERALDAYRECKIRILVDPYYGINDKSFPSCSRSLKLVREDGYICQIFYGLARMIQICHETQAWGPKGIEREVNLELKEQLDAFAKQEGFKKIRQRRLLEENEKSQAKATGESRGESRAKAVLRRRNILEPTFREVVEAFASERGMIFRPKAGAQRDGKLIYLFGKKSIYLEGDVVFCQDDSNANISWRPISLDQLGAMAT